MNNSYITIIKEKRTVLSRKRIPLNQNECTADFRIGVPFEQNLHRYRFPIPLQAHPPVPGGISCCSLPVLPVPEVQAGPVHAKPHHSSCFCHFHTAWVLRPSPLFLLFQETVRSVPGFLQKTPHSAWEFSHLSIILSKNGTKATKLLF